MLSFAQTADRIAETSKKLEKTAIVAEYLNSLDREDAARAALFLSGRPFPAYEEATLGVGGSLLWQAVSELSGKSDLQLRDLYRTHGDLGAVAAAARPERSSKLTLSNLEEEFRAISSTRGPVSKLAIILRLLGHASPSEAKYIIKIITGDLRIGLKESLVEESIAKAYDVPLKDVQRANMGRPGSSQRYPPFRACTSLVRRPLVGRGSSRPTAVRWVQPSNNSDPCDCAQSWPGQLPSKLREAHTVESCRSGFACNAAHSRSNTSEEFPVPQELR